MNEMSYTFNFKVGQIFADSNGYVVEIVGFFGSYISVKNEDEDEQDFEVTIFIGDFSMIGGI